MMRLDWPAMEAEIAALLSSSARERDRATLLAKVARYADAVVGEASRRGPASPGHDEFEQAAWLERPIFICGHHRSGTTLLQGLLDGHPELLVLPSEGTYLSSFRYVARPNPSQRDLYRFAADWVARFLDPNFDPHFKLGRSDALVNPSVRFVQRLLGWRQALLDAHRAPAAFASMLALAAAFRDVAAATATPRLWVEKTPLNEFHVERLRVFPHALFIHLIREPGATLGSLLKMYRTAGIERVNSAEHAQAIGQSIRQARRNQLKYRGRYLIVRYEDLTANTYEEVERVRAFLGISGHSSLTVPTSVGQPVRANSSFARGAPGVVHQSGVAQLTAVDRRLVIALTDRHAKLFGYDVEALSNAHRYAIRIRHLPAHVLRRVRRRLNDLASHSFGDS